MREEGHRPLPLFQTKAAKGRMLFKAYAFSMLTAICWICGYRVSQAPPQGAAGRYLWFGLFMAELWFTLYWLLTQLVRWNPVHHDTFKRRLSQVLPGVDVFVCTADPVIEPPIMVVNTVLSAMAYDYPQEKLQVYVSDDGGSELMFYALLEASRFARHWLPFCTSNKIEPRSPSAYFAEVDEAPLPVANEWSTIKKKYEEMKKRIDSTTKLGMVTQELRKEHRGFQEWDVGSNKHDHPPIVQILIHNKDPSAIDVEGKALPNLVYLAREKRPKYHHNFKAGAMNALIRVSSRISNSPIILNMDCDMYSNNSESVRDALCFFMDQEKGQRIAYVQFPQNFDNLTRNDVYGNSLRVINEVEVGGLDSNGGCLYIGSGCFHRRDALCGRHYSKDARFDWEKQNAQEATDGRDVLENACKVLASCSYEQNTEWGKEMGLKYGCPVEDVITGLAIKCRGWRSVHFNPERKGFLGLAPTTLLQTLVQQKRWAEGDFQIFLSEHCPLIFGHGRIPLKLQVSYCCYLFWAVNCWATLSYVTIPSYCLLRDISLFPKLSSYWFLPFAYVFFGRHSYSLGEFYWCGGTFKGWWNDQRMWMYKRLTSYLFAFFDAVLKSVGFAHSGFVITSKVSEEDVSQRYERELMEFGVTSPMFNVLSTLALVNLVSFLKWVVVDFYGGFTIETILCGFIVVINLPLYQGLFFRKDNGSMPSSVTHQSTVLAILASTLALI